MAWTRGPRRRLFLTMREVRQSPTRRLVDWEFYLAAFMKTFLVVAHFGRRRRARRSVVAGGDWGLFSKARSMARDSFAISLRRPFTLTQYVCGRLGDAFSIRPARSPSLVRKTTPLAA